LELASLCYSTAQKVIPSSILHSYYAGWELDLYRDTMARGTARHFWVRLTAYWPYYLGPFLSLPLIALPWMIRDRRVRLPLVVVATGILGLELEVWNQPHYAAPLTCAVFAVLLQGMRHLQFWRWRAKQFGRVLVRLVVMGCLAFDAAWISAVAVHVNYPSLYSLGNLHRASILQRLNRKPGSHLVIVRYSPSHQVWLEWVYDRADIDHAKAVWARDMGDGCNGQLIAYFWSSLEFWTP
jgi:hypothetical protein